MGIQAFLFDCGGVLLRDADLSPYRTWAERLGLSEGALRERLWAGETWRLAERGEISDDEFWRRSAADLGLCDAADAQALRDDLWTTWEVDPLVLALIDRVRRTHRVAMLSNASDALEEILAERYGVADRFECILNSARLGVAKPARAIYELALARLGVAAGDTVFVDDRAENVAAAADLGMHVIWYVNAGELQRQMEPYLGAAPAGEG